MKTVTLAKLANIIQGKLSSRNPNASVSDVNFGRIRAIHPHQVYFYSTEIRPEKQFNAIAKLKPLAVVLPNSVSSSRIPSFVSLIRVSNSYQAFWKVAVWNWKQHSVRIIGISGSTGKSTTTAMVFSILKYRTPMVRTEGNLNTLTFLPHYLVRLKPNHRLLLLEMGMKSLNNIRLQCQVVRPEIGAITNVGEAHVGSLGNLNLVIRAKQELVDGIRAGGTLYLNADDTRSRALNTSRFQGKLRTFGIKQKADIRGQNVRYVKNGMAFNVLLNGKDYSFYIPTYGVHNVYNALAAIGIAKSYGATVSEIQKGLAEFRTPQMRLQMLRSRSGRLLINDAWNANPTSMMAGIGVLRDISPNRPTIAVLGDMLELGNLSQHAHAKVGKYVADRGIYQLVTLGPKARWIAQAAQKNGMDAKRIFPYKTFDQVLRHIAHTSKNAVVYFKASRKWKFEKLVKRARAL